MDAEIAAELLAVKITMHWRADFSKLSTFSIMGRVVSPLPDSIRKPA